MKPQLYRNLLTLALAAAPLALHAQDKPAASAPAAPTEDRSSVPFDPRITDCSKQPTRSQVIDCGEATARDYTIYLQNVAQQNDANEILVAIRNLLDPSVRVFLVSSQNAIAIRTYPEMFARAETIVKTLDRPHPTFRLTYTITDFDSGKLVGTQHYTLMMADGQRNTLKQGSKIPVATGSYSDGKASPSGAQTQFTYLDVGMNIDATLTGSNGRVHLLSKVEQSSAAPEPVVIVGVSEPVIRQSVLSGTVDFPLGKPVVLGSIDVPGTTHRLDVAVSAEPLP